MRIFLTLIFVCAFLCGFAQPPGYIIMEGANFSYDPNDSIHCEIAEDVRSGEIDLMQFATFVEDKARITHDWTDSTGWHPEFNKNLFGMKGILVGLWKLQEEEVLSDNRRKLLFRGSLEGYTANVSCWFMIYENLAATKETSLYEFLKGAKLLSVKYAYEEL